MGFNTNVKSHVNYYSYENQSVNIICCFIIKVKAVSANILALFFKVLGN